MKAVRKKFQDDLESARGRRAGRFTAFAFVHNDRRGVRPVAATLLAEARNGRPALTFEELGGRALRQELMQLDVALAGGEAFHLSAVRNRRRFLDAEIEELSQRLEGRRAERARLGGQPRAPSSWWPGARRRVRPRAAVAVPGPHPAEARGWVSSS
ncbi:hypothetical protein GCM10009759_72520 [Kitasatospora saccharophila]|uniref:Uncharacterized protein n=1 Tax=Kitasatospora saccharophila TaxID=407973 RepID=A0ABN2Y966_9ACTN